MANQRCWVVVGIVVALVAQPARAEPVVTQKIVNYDVSGNTPAEIRANLNSNGPIDQRSNRRFDARTDWNVRWRYRYSMNGQSCAIASVTTSVEITITLPQLKADTATPPELSRAFAAYIEKVVIHEKGHGENGIEIARRVEAAIGKLPPRPTCDELGQAANALGKQITQDEGSRLDIEYDDRTKHGRTQGATFP